MARGNARSRVNNPIDNNVQKTKAPNNVETAQSIKKEIDHHWKLCMPTQAKIFLLETLDFPSLHKLAKFWSSPSVIEYTRNNIACDRNTQVGSHMELEFGRLGMSWSCFSSWFIALNYLKLGKVQEARILTLNGSFLHQCLVSIVA